MSPQPVNSFPMNLKTPKITVQPIITKGFIFNLQKLNAEVTIFSQWDQLEKTGCINNFRIIADHNNQFFREGYYFADSDAYKWLDAACRIQKTHSSNKLLEKINIIGDLIVRTQESDGYIFTYNQIHFPGVRWKNLLREHELYCIGHLIEAGISHYKINTENTILNACIKVADLLVSTFLNKRHSSIPGHEEIELALLKLYEITQKEDYLFLAKQFLERRGKLSFFWIRFLQTNSSTEHRSKFIENKKQEFYEQNHIPKVILPDNVKFSVPKDIKRKYFFNFATGKYIQSHKPIQKQFKPEGHAVRFSYLVTACAMLIQTQLDTKLLILLNYHGNT